MYILRESHLVSCGGCSRVMALDFVAQVFHGVIDVTCATFSALVCCHDLGTVVGLLPGPSAEVPDNSVLQDVGGRHGAFPAQVSRSYLLSVPRLRHFTFRDKVWCGFRACPIRIAFGVSRLIHFNLW